MAKTDIHTHEHHLQTEVSLSLSLTNTYNQHLWPLHLCIYDENTEHSFSGCPGDTNYRVREGLWDDAGERRLGTPCDEQGLSNTHTPLPGVSVCVFMSNLHRFHKGMCARLPFYDNY